MTDSSPGLSPGLAYPGPLRIVSPEIRIQMVRESPVRAEGCSAWLAIMLERGTRMEFRQLGDTGFEASVIRLGTWVMGG